MDGKFYISRKEQACLTKKKIFDTTMLLIKKKGYGKITIREICQSTDISIGTFYLYFSSKDEILLEIYEKADRNLSPPASDVSVTIPKVCSYFHNYLKDVTEMFEKELFREVYRISLSTGDNRFLANDRPLYQAVLTTFSEAADSQNYKLDIPASELCYKAHIFVQSYVFQWLVDDSLSRNYLTEYCIEDLRRYLTLYLYQ